MLPIISGQGVSSAPAYDPDELGPHPVLIMTRTGKEFIIDAKNEYWNEYLSYFGWLPPLIDKTELVVIGAERVVSLDSAHYVPGPDITRYRFDLDVELREVHTGQILATHTFQGPDPGPFPVSAPLEQTRLDGDHVKFNDFATWLCPYIEPQSCWITEDIQQNPTMNAGPYSLTFSPDGQSLASGSENGGAQLWPMSESYFYLLEPDGDTYRTKGAAFSPNGQTLASSSDDGSVRLWKVSDRSLIRTLEGHTGPANSIAFSPDGLTLASGSDDGSVRLWKVSDGALIHILEGHTGPVNNVAFSPDGLTLASGSDDGSVRLWKVSDATLLRTLGGGEERVVGVHGLSFSPDGKTLASGSDDGYVIFWRISDGRQLPSFMNYDEPHCAVTSVAFSPDGNTLASGSDCSAGLLWHLQQRIRR